jgi:hypothetical protein
MLTLALLRRSPRPRAPTCLDEEQIASLEPSLRPLRPNSNTERRVFGDLVWQLSAARRLASPDV